MRRPCVVNDEKALFMFSIEKTKVTLGPSKRLVLLYVFYALSSTLCPTGVSYCFSIQTLFFRT